MNLLRAMLCTVIGIVVVASGQNANRDRGMSRQLAEEYMPIALGQLAEVRITLPTPIRRNAPRAVRVSYKGSDDTAINIFCDEWDIILHGPSNRLLYFSNTSLWNKVHRRMALPCVSGAVRGKRLTGTRRNRERSLACVAVTLRQDRIVLGFWVAPGRD